MKRKGRTGDGEHQRAGYVKYCPFAVGQPSRCDIVYPIVVISSESRLLEENTTAQ